MYSDRETGTYVGLVDDEVEAGTLAVDVTLDDEGELVKI
jgi:hypothetical protein